MVERSKRGGKGKRKLLGSHQRCWLWGRHLVTETLAAQRWPILELHLAEDLPDAERQSAQTAAGNATVPVPVHVESRDVLTRLCHAAEHQGYFAKMAPFPYQAAGQVLAARTGVPLYLVLDSIQDPYNFGAMLRSAEVFGVGGVFIGTPSQVEVTSMVARSSAGAVNRVAIAQVESLPELLRNLRNDGIAVVGASEKSERTLIESDFRGPTAIVIGNEGTGISPDVAALCTATARIPLYGALGSLNAAAAAAVMCYEVRRQRESKSAPQL